MLSLLLTAMLAQGAQHNPGVDIAVSTVKQWTSYPKNEQECGDPKRACYMAWNVCGICCKERQEGLFKLFITWWGRETSGRIFAREMGRDGWHYGPLMLNEQEVVNAAQRLKWLKMRPSPDDVAKIMHWYTVDQDDAIKISVNHAAFLLEKAGWDDVVDGIMACCGTHPGQITRSRYMPRFLFLYLETWGEQMPLSLEIDKTSR